MLAPYALRPEESLGRRYPEPSHPYRNDFQRDRDRVIHARAFRRLENKTQVFTRRYSDHFRNRLTHTIEVSQISRTIAAELGLNEDLVETLALVHDIGHPPFGHSGERILNIAMQEHDESFDHNLHALHIEGCGHDSHHAPAWRYSECARRSGQKVDDKSFDHNLHALHIVEQFEQRYAEFPGLNLTFEVREG